MNSTQFSKTNFNYNALISHSRIVIFMDSQWLIKPLQILDPNNMEYYDKII